MTTTIDDFTDVSGWHPVASGLAQLAISQDDGPRGKALRLDFDFRGGGGFVVARKLVALSLPESYAFHLDVRGSAPPNRFELKLVDPSGRNVWWYHADDFEFPADWQAIRITSSDVEFAWGPAGGGAIGEVAAIELVIAARTGGTGTVWFHELRLEDRTVRVPPTVRASSALPGHAAENVLAPSPTSTWRSEASPEPQWLEIDFHAERELGGLVIRWEGAGRARAFSVRTSDDGQAWTTVHSATQADTSTSYVYTPRTSARGLRIELLESVEARGFGIVAIEIQPFEFSRSIHAFFQAVARDHPPGAFPKWLSPEQTYWSPVGLPDGETRALLNEEGMVEVDRGTFSLEPFLLLGDRLVTWADAVPTQSLEHGYLPIPTSTWRVDETTLATSAFATRVAGRVVLFVRYRVQSRASRAQRKALFVALRPFQVTPPWQAFGELGGVAKVGELEWSAGVVRVERTRTIVPLVDPDGFGAAAFEAGAISVYLREGRLPPHPAVRDAFGYASGALRFDLPASASREVHLAIPFGTVEPGDPVVTQLRRCGGADELARAIVAWEGKLGHVEIQVPSLACDHVATMRTALAHVLVNRDGAALQPGPRRYTRSWIRDGAIMAAALLRMGCSEEAMAFVRWYASYQAADGTVPCCVDRTGPDWLVEHDSHGELVYAVTECFRFTGDRTFLAELWPAVRRAVDHLERLRSSRLGPGFQVPERRAMHGLLPESASHEGYLAHPVHAYWDDFWAVRALGDAAAMAEVLGDAAEQRRLGELQDALRASVRTSIDTVMAERGIAYLPASVEWADFDPTATANPISLLGELPHLPRAALDATFDQYLEGFRRRRRGEIDWANYSPYEIRIVGALVQLGRRTDANELADVFLADRRPRAWNQWPEIAWRDPKSPGHLGDVPHACIGAEYLLAFRSMLAYEREADRALVLAAGIPWAWLDGGDAVTVRRLPTYYGAIDFTLCRVGANRLSCTIGGHLGKRPPRIVIVPPLPGPLVGADVNGAPTDSFDAHGATTTEFPADVVIRY